jgi:hypothetical protein
VALYTILTLVRRKDVEAEVMAGDVPPGGA